MDGRSANNRILTLVKGTHPLIMGNSVSSQEIHKETSTPRRSVWGFGYPCASSIHDNVRVLYILQPLQRLVVHLVARVSNYFLYLSKISTLNQNTTPITNRLEILTHSSPNITRNNTSKLLQITTKLIIATQLP